MSFVAAAIAGAAVVGLGGAYMQSSAARSAADTQANAANAATNLSAAQYEEQRQDAAPWRTAGVQALGQLQSELPDLSRSFTAADMTADPGYAFRMQQGQQAIERSAAAKGGLDSGATLKALTAYGQNEGSQEYQSAYNRFTNDQTTRFNRLASMSGVGQNANTQIAADGTNMVNSVNNSNASAANASAAGTIGQANAIAGAAGQGLNSWMNYSMMNRLMPQQTSQIPSYAPTNYASIPSTYSGTLGTIGEE